MVKMNYGQPVVCGGGGGGGGVWWCVWARFVIHGVDVDAI